MTDNTYCTKHEDYFHHTLETGPVCFKGTPNDPCVFEQTYEEETR